MTRAGDLSLELANTYARNNAAPAETICCARFPPASKPIALFTFERAFTISRIISLSPSKRCCSHHLCPSCAKQVDRAQHLQYSTDFETTIIYFTSRSVARLIASNRRYELEIKMYLKKHNQWPQRRFKGRVHFIYPQIYELMIIYTHTPNLIRLMGLIL